DAGHHREPLVADLAERALQMRHILVEAAGKLHEMLLLPLVAGHAVGPAVDRHRHLRHRRLPYLSSTARMVSIAVTSRRDTSLLACSSRSARASELSSSWASRARSAFMRWTSASASP